ncbi:hypothetical protein JOD43_000942 [Pullulanibacillus pueri]|uniref:DUF2812 domain-containing protein n=1 Tax=Pullulanibacillus pueri TaxID=1437324 RepID=A0A8J2ZUT2_9BACL|nr:DUF2812 domain-containing protein [Pullulanibacillus pueri]MBM7680778.1 hypothetical protein [Pullulanibacillus pueri]GGH78295.1 hypothetical protein GCM10007096_11500 [Pullulanibacillus pueri]
MKQKKRCFKIFWAWQDEKEEHWLSQMAKSGWYYEQWHFPFIYSFSKGRPHGYIYKSDYRPKLSREDREEYLAIFKDAGWDYVMDQLGWYYFRADGEARHTTELFSDTDSKVQKYKQLLKTLTTIFIAVVIIYMAIVAFNPNSYMLALKIIYPLLLVLLLFANLKIMVKIKSIRRLKR